MFLSPTLFRALAGATLALLGTAALAQFKNDPPMPAATVATTAADPSIELLHSSKVTLTRGDYDTQLLRLPEDARGSFGTNIDRINTLLRVILVDKTLSTEARAEGIDKDPVLQRKIAAETDSLLAQEMIRRAEEQYQKTFDARPNLEQGARERWLAMPDRYREPEQYQTTQIQYSFDKNGGSEGAREKAADARRRIQAGGDMNAIAKAESDDPTAAQTGGKLDWRPARAFDVRLARAIGNLRNPGDLSRPIETDDSFVLVRMDAKRPGEKKSFDDVKASIIADMRKEYVSTMMNQKMAAIRNDPSIVVNQPAVEALVTRINPAFTAPPTTGTEPPPPQGRPSGPARARPATQ
jgi:peptidyl-prolyl cis-trans isomerase C